MQIDRIVREPERKEITGLNRTSWWEMMRDGEAPQSVTLKGRAKGWRLSDLMAWVESRQAS